MTSSKNSRGKLRFPLQEIISVTRLCLSNDYLNFLKYNMLPRYLTWCGACACVNDRRIRNETGVAFPPYKTKYELVRIL